MEGCSGHGDGRPPKTVDESGGSRDRTSNGNGTVAEAIASANMLSLQTSIASFHSQHSLRQQQLQWRTSEPSPLYQYQSFSGQGSLQHPGASLSVSELQQQHNDTLRGASQQQQGVPYALLLLRQHQQTQGLLSGSSAGLDQPEVNIGAFRGAGGESLARFQLPTHLSRLTEPSLPLNDYQRFPGGGVMMNPNLLPTASYMTENPTASLSQLYDVHSSSFPSSLQASFTLTARLPETAASLDFRQHQMIDDMILSQAAVLQRQNMDALIGSQTQQHYQTSSFPKTPSMGNKRSTGSGSSESVPDGAIMGDVSLASNKRAKVVGKPKRPLSAYNIFFKEERQKLLSTVQDEEGSLSNIEEENGNKKPQALGSKNLKRVKPPGKIGFESMAKIIGQRWKDIALDANLKSYFQNLADTDKDRYLAELEVWKRQESEALTVQRNELECSVDVRTKERYFTSVGILPAKQQRKSNGYEPPRKMGT